MAATISISDKNSDIWMIKNSIYCEFVDLVISKLGDTPLSEELKLSVHFNGIALEEMENPKRALEIAKAMQKVASQICSSQLILSSFNSLNYEECRTAFCELFEILTRLTEEH